MAIRVDFTDAETGATYTAAYVRVLPGSIRLDFTKQYGEYDALVFFSATAAAAGKTRVALRHVTISGADFQTVFGIPVVNRAYAHLKTLSDFSGGVDV